MTDLTVVADAAYPFDYGVLSPEVTVVLGYVGEPGETPHVWTREEVAAVRAAGRQWFPIHTVPPSQLHEPGGTRAGHLMVGELKAYDLPAGCPVFLDVEHSSYVASPVHAARAVTAWQKIMTDAGHPVAIPYLPAAAGHGWIADWTGQRPTTLPDRVAGWQYDHALAGDKYDISVFRAHVFAGADQKGRHRMAGLSTEDRQWIAAQLQTVQDSIGAQLRHIAIDDDPGTPRPWALRHLHQTLEQLAHRPATGADSEPDPATIADAIVSKLGPGLALHVVNELARRLGRAG